MLIGHLPAGYLASTAALDRLGVEEGLRRRLLASGLVASVAPDLDLLFFYGVDSSVHHHALFPHWPATWLAVLGVGLIVARIRKSRAWALGAAFVGGGGLLHILLDTIAGEVRWLAPFSEWSLTLVTVPPSFDSWILSFITHWTFGVEIALSIVAVAVWRWRSAAGHSPRRVLWLRLGVGLAGFAAVWAWLTFSNPPPAPDRTAIEKAVGVPLGEPVPLPGSRLQEAVAVAKTRWTLYRLPIPNQVAVRADGAAWLYRFALREPYVPPPSSPLACQTLSDGVTTCNGVLDGHRIWLYHAASGTGTVRVRLEEAPRQMSESAVTRGRSRSRIGG